MLPGGAQNALQPQVQRFGLCLLCSAAGQSPTTAGYSDCILLSIPASPSAAAAQQSLLMQSILCRNPSVLQPVT